MIASRSDRLMFRRRHVDALPIKVDSDPDRGAFVTLRNAIMHLLRILRLSLYAFLHVNGGRSIAHTGSRNAGGITCIHDYWLPGFNVRCLSTAKCTGRWTAPRKMRVRRLGLHRAHRGACAKPRRLAGCRHVSPPWRHLSFTAGDSTKGIVYSHVKLALGIFNYRPLGGVAGLHRNRRTRRLDG